MLGVNRIGMEGTMLIGLTPNAPMASMRHR